jgi:hypothetical protein
MNAASGRFAAPAQIEGKINLKMSAGIAGEAIPAGAANRPGKAAFIH